MCRAGVISPELPAEISACTGEASYVGRRRVWKGLHLVIPIRAPFQRMSLWPGDSEKVLSCLAGPHRAEFRSDMDA